MLKGKRTNQFAWAILASVWVIPAAVGQTGVVRTAGSAQHVVDALGLSGIAVGSEQIEFLSGINGPRESMRVVSVSDGTAGTVKVKLRCRDNHECLPFYVLVHGLDEENVGSKKPLSSPAAKATSVPSMIRGGDHATLILESSDSRMSFPVICLQSGARGQRVRVVSTDRKQLFDAEVVAPGILKGSL
jgi:hypothetical protein